MSGRKKSGCSALSTAAASSAAAAADGKEAEVDTGAREGGHKRHGDNSKGILRTTSIVAKTFLLAKNFLFCFCSKILKMTPKGSYLLLNTHIFHTLVDCVVCGLQKSSILLL